VAPSYRSVGQKSMVSMNSTGFGKTGVKPGLKSFKKPESTVEEQEIKIPQFFQKNRSQKASVGFLL